MSAENLLDDSAPQPSGITASDDASDGLQASVNSIDFINKEVLQNGSVGLNGTAKPMADQAAAMMLEDMRSFLQGSEQIMTIALGKATAMALSPDPATAEAGNKALTSITGVLNTLPTFASSIGQSATDIAKNFDNQPASKETLSSWSELQKASDSPPSKKEQSNRDDAAEITEGESPPLKGTAQNKMPQKGTTENNASLKKDKGLFSNLFNY